LARRVKHPGSLLGIEINIQTRARAARGEKFTLFFNVLAHFLLYLRILLGG
jgi:hypothetical protein